MSAGEEYYLTRPRRARVDWWNSTNKPPEGVHDIWWNANLGATAGWVKTPLGERIIHVGQYLVTYEDTGEQEILEHRDVNERFIKVVS